MWAELFGSAGQGPGAARPDHRCTIRSYHGLRWQVTAGRLSWGLGEGEEGLRGRFQGGKRVRESRADLGAEWVTLGKALHVSVSPLEPCLKTGASALNFIRLNSV